VIPKQMQHRGLALAGAVALAVAACSGSSSTPAPSSPAAASSAPAVASAPAASTGAAASADAGGATGNPISALSDLNSYKLNLTMSSKGTTGGLAALGDISMQGTVVAKPEKATDITVTLGGAAPGASAAGLSMRIVEVNGKTYTDFGTGTLTESTDSSQASMAASLSPEKLLGSLTSYLTLMQPVGDEQKNGVATTHYQGDDKTFAAAAPALAMLGLKDAKWTWDVWIAKEGGYAVSYAMNGSGSDNASMSVTMDVSDVNSPSNVVKGP
jgi:hypothetical protein